MVLAVIGDPADRAALGSAASNGSQNVLAPARPKCKTAMREQAMIRQADADPPREPVEENADREPGPGKKGRHKSKQRQSVQGSNPDQWCPCQTGRRGLRRGRCRHNQPLFVCIAEDGFVVVGGLREASWQVCRELQSHVFALKCYNWSRTVNQARRGDYLFTRGPLYSHRKGTSPPLGIAQIVRFLKESRRQRRFQGREIGRPG